MAWPTFGHAPELVKVHFSAVKAVKSSDESKSCSAPKITEASRSQSGWCISGRRCINRPENIPPRKFAIDFYCHSTLRCTSLSISELLFLQACEKHKQVLYNVPCPGSLPMKIYDSLLLIFYNHQISIHAERYFFTIIRIFFCNMYSKYSSNSMNFFFLRYSFNINEITNSYITLK